MQFRIEAAGQNQLNRTKKARSFMEGTDESEKCYSVVIA